MMTYISLFSSAGIGCYGFKLEGFECVATNELIPRRLDIQRYNNKCKYESGYICGDITTDETKEQLFSQIRLWETQEHMGRVDVLIATPPCQGMSVANHKKTTTEIVRNSLVVESIKIIKKVRPKFFIFENVPAFMKTICTDVDGADKPISAAIFHNLGDSYSYTHRIINFKDHGACSSRQRAVVIGVANDYANDTSPMELYPPLIPERTLREVIGHLKPLTVFGEIDETDIYHAFRTYPEHMRMWISGLKEGESAFDNVNDEQKPHQVIDGKIVINQQKNGDKYRRQCWDKVGPCIHTRNDQLASQNTIHPSDDRVFSIRELMLMMTVPSDFKWTADSLDALNAMPVSRKKSHLKKEEIKIRQSLGEAVPTIIFREIAKKIKAALLTPPLNTSQINKIMGMYDFSNAGNLIDFIDRNPLNLPISVLSRIAELSNTKRTDNAAFFTSKPLITEIMRNLPQASGDVVRILEPSVGVGNFLPLILQKFEGKEILIDAVDIDANSIEVLKALLKHYTLPDNCHINFIVDDFLTHSFHAKYDYVIGNPPFCKMETNSNQLKEYRKQAINKQTSNICSFFLDKAQAIGNYVALIFPKFLLNTPEFAPSREYLRKKSVECILDFGEKGFPGVLVETIAIFINNLGRPSKTHVISIAQKIDMIQSQKYIFDPEFPYWLIYRNADFDRVSKKMQFNVFSVFRDRQITNKQLNGHHGIRVIKSRNISDDGKSIVDIDGYDSYIEEDDARQLSVYPFMGRDDVYLTPNMTYNPRVIKKPPDVLVNGSVAILIPRSGCTPTEQQLAFFSSHEYRTFYQIARNYQTRSLNVDNCSVYFYGLLQKGNEVPKMLKDNDIVRFCEERDFDLRKSHNGRWIDQKCTPDVVWSISDFILDYVDNVGSQFTVKDIWQSEYAKETIAETFSKPGTDEKTAEREYDKVFSQPLCMLCYAGVLKDVSPTSRHLYEIENRDVLEYIAKNDMYSLRFLYVYIEKVLKDSGLYPVFDAFFNRQDKAHFNAVKQAFIKFYHEHTPIKKDFEPKRIFTKVLNPLAFRFKKKGTEGGHMSKTLITKADMMYNQDNFRDVYKDKPKDMTRKEWLALHPDINRRDGYFEQQMSHSKKQLRKFIAEYRENTSELTMFIDERDDMAEPSQMHHIFPKNEFPAIMHYIENLIALTPNQHYGFAHPRNNTQIVDPAAQKELLIAKTCSIKQNLESDTEEPIYEFANLLQVLSVGWDDENILNIRENDYSDVFHAINYHYQT